LHATLDSGAEVGLFLDRGQVLRGGDVLKTEEGDFVQVCAAQENVSTVKCDSTHLFARACYHLGNRHVPLEINSHYLRYQHDHVLDDMLRQLGCQVVHEQAPFEPESGAYAHAHSHSHNHTHDK
jgi:urease accessory protein